MVDVEVAAWSLAHDYPGGAAALGIQSGVNCLAQKLCPTNDRNHLMLKEAVRIQLVSGDHRILHAMAENLGEVCVPLPQVHDDDLIHATLRSIKSHGAMMGEIEGALKDGNVSPNELKKIQLAMLESVAHITALYSLLSGKAR